MKVHVANADQCMQWELVSQSLIKMQHLCHVNSISCGLSGDLLNELTTQTQPSHFTSKSGSPLLRISLVHCSPSVIYCSIVPWLENYLLGFQHCTLRSRRNTFVSLVTRLSYRRIQLTQCAKNDANIWCQLTINNESKIEVFVMSTGDIKLTSTLLLASNSCCTLISTWS